MESSNMKFMQTLDPKHFREAKRLASERGVSLQMLIRTVIIPEWMQRHSLSEKKEKPIPVHS